MVAESKKAIAGNAAIAVIEVRALRPGATGGAAGAGSGDAVVAESAGCAT